MVPKQSAWVLFFFIINKFHVFTFCWFYNENLRSKDFPQMLSAHVNGWFSYDMALVCEFTAELFKLDMIFHVETFDCNKLWKCQVMALCNFNNVVWLKHELMYFKSVSVFLCCVFWYIYIFIRVFIFGSYIYTYMYTWLLWKIYIINCNYKTCHIKWKKGKPGCKMISNFSLLKLRSH